jgi:hypothetical protein
MGCGPAIAMLPSRHVARQMINSRWFVGPVTVGDLLEIVAAVGEDPLAVDKQIEKLYEWHHTRAMTAIQLALAPAAISALALATKTTSSLGDGIALGIVALSLAVAMWRLNQVNQFDREYVYALRLGRALVPLHGHLAKSLHGLSLDATAESVGQAATVDSAAAYSELASITMTDYRVHSDTRARARRILCQLDAA